MIARAHHHTATGAHQDYLPSALTSNVAEILDGRGFEGAAVLG